MSPEIIAALDGNNLRPVIEDVARELGYSGVAYSDSVSKMTETLSQANEEAPKLVVFDFELEPDEAWRFLEGRQNNPELSGIPVLVLARTADPSVQEYMEKLGAKVLMRPFLIDNLKEILLEIQEDGR